MVHLQKECFPVGTCNKMKMKKFVPCKIVKRHDSGNAYEVELPAELNISPIFNILDLTEFYEGGDGDELKISSGVFWQLLQIHRRLKKYWIVMLAEAQGTKLMKST